MFIKKEHHVVWVPLNNHSYENVECTILCASATGGLFRVVDCAYCCEHGDFINHVVISEVVSPYDLSLRVLLPGDGGIPIKVRIIVLASQHNRILISLVRVHCKNLRLGVSYRLKAIDH